MRLFKLESSQKGSHIQFKEFEILLFKLSKIIYADLNINHDKKYFKLIQTILSPSKNDLLQDYKYQKRNKTLKKSKKNMNGDKLDGFLPNVENYYKLLILRLEKKVNDQLKIEKIVENFIQET